MLFAIEKELMLKNDRNELIKTIYFGGGTPSILSLDEIQSILNVVNNNFNVVDNPEITLEANPDDLTSEKIIALSKSPINRLSIGVQSFFEEDLKFMNRAHSAEESKKCLKDATQYFDNITIDLIYGVPNMSSEKWLANLKMAFDFGVPHISSYALTVEEKTALASFIKKGTVPPVDEELALEHFNILVEETEKQEFVHYEISNFGKPNFFSKHNMSYWQGEKYIGIGPSAHSFNGVERSWNVSNNSKYIKALEENCFPSETETLTVNNRFNEYVMTGLRTIWGVSFQKIEKDFGIETLNNFIRNAKPFIDKELLTIQKDENTIEYLTTTKKGKFLADGIASDLFML